MTKNPHACRNAGESTEGIGSAQIFFQATGIERQPILRIIIQDSKILAELPKPTFRQPGRGLSLGGLVCGLVQPSAPPQRHQVRDAPTTSHWSGRGDLPWTGSRLRTSAPAKPKTLVKVNQVLASTRGGLDQSTTTGT